MKHLELYVSGKCNEYAARFWSSIELGRNIRSGLDGWLVRDLFLHCKHKFAGSNLRWRSGGWRTDLRPRLHTDAELEFIAVLHDMTVL